MNDRELLEMAAKAAGIPKPFQVLRNGTWVFDEPRVKNWNPLTDDGDALRLAVKLNLHKAIAEAHRLVSDKTDFYAATRIAIVRAAAEIYSRSSATASANSDTGSTGGV